MEKARVTKKDMLGELKVLAEDAERFDLAEFCEKEITRLANRKATPSKKDVENERIMEVMVEVLGGLEDAITVSDLIKADERLDYSSQKISALMTKLVNAGKVNKVVEKKRSYFKLAD